MSTYRFGLGPGFFSKAAAATGILLLLMLFSIAVALSPKWGAILTVIAFGGILSLVVPVHWMLMALFLLSSVLAGSLEYFGKSTHAFWLASIVPLVMAGRTMLAKASSSSLARHGQIRNKVPFSASMLKFSLILYFSVLVFSALVNQSPILQVLVAAKNYIFIWFALYVFMKSDRYQIDVDLLWKMIVWVSLLQLPVVLYQRFFIASKISNTAAGLSWDAVSGTFGGGVTGGYSAAMALFIVLAVSYLLIRWRDGSISTARAFGLIALMMPSILLAEVKMAIIWLLVVAIAVFSSGILKRPLLSLFSILAVSGLAVVVLVTYNAMYYADTYTSTYGLYEKQIGYVLDSDRFNPVTKEIGRVASIVFWWDQNKMADLFTLLFGSGPGASRSVSSIAVGVAAEKYSYFIDTSSLTALLWDAGVMGVISFLSIGLFAFFAIRRAISKGKLDPARRAQAEAASIGLILVFSGFAYNRDSIDCLAIQFLLIFAVSIALRFNKEPGVKIHSAIPGASANPATG